VTVRNGRATAVLCAACAAWCAVAPPGAAGVRGSGEAGRPFDALADAAVVVLAPVPDREAFSAALADAGANWTELARAVESLRGEERDDCVWLINGMPHLDRIEMKADNLIEHVVYAHRARREMPYRMPDEMFRSFVLTYRVEDEPLLPWRQLLFQRFAPWAREDGTAAGVARRINADLAAGTTKLEPDFFGPRKPPSLTLEGASGSEADISILACAAMKAVGIPSRQVSVAALGEEPGDRNWIEIFDGERWLPLYPLSPDAFGDFGHVERGRSRNVTVAATRTAFERSLATESYSATAVLDLAFVADGAPASGFETFSVCVLNRGGLAALDALETAADDSGRFRAVVGDGTYVVMAGTRDGAGNAVVTMEQVQAAPGETVYASFDVSQGRAASALTPQDLASLRGALEARVAYDPSEEPSARMLPLIRRALECRAPAVSVTYERASGAAGVGGAPRARLPRVTVYAAGGGAAILDREGYDLNIGRALLEAVDAELARTLGRAAEGGNQPGVE
jgi:hypothetical protein